MKISGFQAAINTLPTNKIKNVLSNPVTKITGLSCASAVLGLSLINKHNENVKIKTVCGDDECYVHSMVREYKNPQTGMPEILRMRISDTAGVFNSTITDGKGKTRVESVSRTKNDGSVIVEKNFESLDGTKTSYKYTSSKDKNDIKINYEITSPSGENLMKFERTFNRVSSSLAYSSVNGHKYKIEKDENSINVTDYSSNSTTKIPYEEIFYDDEAKNHSELIDNLSGDMLLDMHSRGFKYNYIDNPDIAECEPCEKVISIKNDLFDFSHELGHTKDLVYSYDEDYNLNCEYTKATNPQFRKVFEEERENFIKNCPKQEQKYIDYFINKEDHYNGENGGAAEFIAEANALLSTSTGSGCNDHLQTRDYYLQKYFPRSIAEASKLLFPQ